MNSNATVFHGKLWAAFRALGSYPNVVSVRGALTCIRLQSKAFNRPRAPRTYVVIFGLPVSRETLSTAHRPFVEADGRPRIRTEITYGESVLGFPWNREHPSGPSGDFGDEVVTIRPDRARLARPRPSFAALAAGPSDGLSNPGSSPRPRPFREARPRIHVELASTGREHRPSRTEPRDRGRNVPGRHRQSRSVRSAPCSPSACFTVLSFHEKPRGTE